VNHVNACCLGRPYRVSSERPHDLPPERLDSLPHDATDARASRRDLRVFNKLLRNERWIRSTVKRHLRTGERVLELGAGEGCLARSLNAEGIPCDALDMAPRPPAWPESSRWFSADAMNMNYRETGHRLVVANLFMHHLNAPQLKDLGASLQENVRVLAVGDLRRSRVHEKMFLLLCGLLGANAVSRHDGVLSIRAGFRRDELPRALGLAPATWQWSISHNIAGAYRMLAIRRI